MTIRSEASVFIDEASVKRPTRKGESLNEHNEVKGEGFVVVRSGVAEPMRDTSGAEALDKNANNLSRRDIRLLRAARYERRYGLWRLSALQRVRDCGRVRVSDKAGIKLVGGSATYSGLATCGSVWCCPVCSSKIMASRSHDVKSAIDAWGSKGKSFIFQTLTMKHHKGQSLDELWNGLSYAWQRLNSGGSAKKEATRYSQSGFIRVVELTHGKNGWHIHIHILRFLDTPPSQNDVEAWAEAQFQRWSNALTKKGLATPMRNAQDFKLTRNAEDLAKYLTKQAHYGGKLSKELTSSATKTAKQGGRKPFEILDGYIANPEGEDRYLWLEYERASKGKKQTHWSNGLRTLLGIEYEKSDDEVACEEIEEIVEEIPVVYLTNSGMKTLTRNKNWQHEALTVAERSGIKALKDYLRLIEVEYLDPFQIASEDASAKDYGELMELLYEYRQH